MSNNAPRVLLIDDEAPVRRFLRAGFEIDGFSVNEAASAGDGLKLLTVRPFDLLIVDLGLPDMDGAQVVERLRAWSTIPLIVLSVRSSEDEKVRLLELGADDYVVKPFGMAELIARARVALRRVAPNAGLQPVVTVERLSIDLAHRNVTLDGEPVQLTPKEYRLLQILAQHMGKVVTHQHLLKEIWGSAQTEAPHYLRILVRKLRQKIEVDSTQPAILQTELGVGYRLAPPRNSRSHG